MPIAAASIRINVSQRNILESQPLRCSPMIFLFDETTAMIAIRGHGDNAVQNRRHDKRLDGINADEIDQKPDQRRDRDHAIKTVRFAEFAVEPFVPAERLGKRIRSGTGEHRNRQ